METIVAFIYNRAEDISDIWYALKARIIWGLNPRNDEVEYLRKLLEHERLQREQFIEYITRAPEPVAEDEKPVWNPIGGFKPWRVIRLELELADRKKAKEMQITDAAVEKLEESLGVKNATQK